MLLNGTKELRAKIILLLYFLTCSTFINFEKLKEPIFEKTRSEKINRGYVYEHTAMNGSYYAQSTPTMQEDFSQQQLVADIDDKDSIELKNNEFYDFDEYARNAPSEHEKTITELTKYLISPTNTEIEKTRVLFIWIATHIKYDAEAFNSGNYPDNSAENVLLSKKAVCEGYSNLLKALCKEAGLEAECVTGYAKGFGYKTGQKFSETNHSWNAIKIDDRWALFDVTWASGFGINKRGKMVPKVEFEPYWFDVNPKEFIFTHLPTENSWQLTNNTIDINKFEMLPYLREPFFKLGFNSDSIYNKAINEKVKSFVETYPVKIPIHIANAPYSRYLNNIDTTNFIFISDLAKEIVLRDGTKWINFLKTNSRFTLSHKSKGKYIDLMVKLKNTDKNYSLFARYTIKN